MNMTTCKTIVCTALLGSLAFTACRDAAPDVEAAEPAGGAITLWTDSIELFMEHPALIVGVPDKFAVHLTDITDYAPVRTGRITLRFTPRDGGSPVVVVQDTPRAPGIYGPSPTFTKPGIYDLTIEVVSPQARDVIQVRDLTVYANPDAAPKDSGEEDPGIPFLKEQQWKTPGFRTDFAGRGEVSASFTATGEVIPASRHYAEASAPISGLVDAGSAAAAPAVGQRVAAGTVLAVLIPSIGEGGSSVAQARAKLREAEDEFARAKRLYDAQAVPQRRLHEAEIALQAARETYAGLGGGLSESGRLAVRSPISGVIATRNVVPGARVEAGTSLFTIVDPSVVWLRVNVPADKAALVSTQSRASFRTGGSPIEFESGRVVSVGSVVDPQSRSVPVVYEVVNRTGAIKIGAVANAAVRTHQRVEGVLIPTSAIIEEEGNPIAYVQVSGERFERRQLTIGGSERGLTLVLSGINDRERVVTGAPYQVRLASLSTAVPAHGHEH
jgi:membrane fusion protein, heavy metal efflux system